MKSQSCPPEPGGTGEQGQGRERGAPLERRGWRNPEAYVGGGLVGEGVTEPICYQAEAEVAALGGWDRGGRFQAGAG